MTSESSAKALKDVSTSEVYQFRKHPKALKLPEIGLTVSSQDTSKLSAKALLAIDF